MSSEILMIHIIHLNHYRNLQTSIIINNVLCCEFNALTVLDYNYKTH